MILSITPCPPTPSPEADQVLSGALYRLDTGNSCVVTPSMRHRPDSPDEVYIAFTFSWFRPPTGAERQEIEDDIRTMLKRDPDVVFEGKKDDVLRSRDEFLNPKRRH